MVGKRSLFLKHLVKINGKVGELDIGLDSVRGCKIGLASKQEKSKFRVEREFDELVEWVLDDEDVRVLFFRVFKWFEDNDYLSGEGEGFVDGIKTLN